MLQNQREVEQLQHERWLHRQDTHTECRYTAKPASDFHVGAHKGLVTSHTRFLAWGFPFAFVVTF